MFIVNLRNCGLNKPHWFWSICIMLVVYSVLSRPIALSYSYACDHILRYVDRSSFLGGGVVSPRFLVRFGLGLVIAFINTVRCVINNRVTTIQC